MAGQFTGIIKELEKQKAAIERALDALGKIDGVTEPATASIEKPATGRKGKKRSAATRRKMREAALARYARLKGEVPV